MTNLFAVIGSPISHSLSPIIHQLFAKQMGFSLTYEKIKAYESEFESVVTNFFATGGKGLNITLPFKQHAFEMAKVRTKRCEKAKAANTLWMLDGALHADTTDGIGLIRDLARHITLDAKKVLILGAGGAARGIIEPLLGANIAELMVANRTKTRVNALQIDFPRIMACALANLNSSFDLIINATSASLVNSDFTLPSSILTPKTYCYDLVYNLDEPTPFVNWARQHGCMATDGLGMLIEQAAEAFSIWHGVMPDTQSVREKINMDYDL